MQRFLTKQLLAEAITEGERVGYNRQIDPRILERLTDESKIHVWQAFPHFHIGGEPAKPHIRLVFDFENQPFLTLDVSDEFYAAMPRE